MNPANAHPKAFVNIILFDKDYKFLDVAYEQVTSSGAPGYVTASYTVKEAGYAFVYVSNEHPTKVDVYFDDVTMTYTPGNIIQYNEYYPFGLQTSASWTRVNNKNNFLYNAANELNPASGWYETFFRGYDPALGRFLQVDPLAHEFSDVTAYNYAGNDPVNFNDPNGDLVSGGSSNAMLKVYARYANDWSQSTSMYFSTMSQNQLEAFLIELTGMNGGGPDGRVYEKKDGVFGYWKDDQTIRHDEFGTVIGKRPEFVTNASEHILPDDDDFPGGTLYHDVENGLNTLWNASFRNGSVYRENMGYFTPDGLLILSNKNNTSHSSRHGETSLKNGTLFVYWGDSIFKYWVSSILTLTLVENKTTRLGLIFNLVLPECITML